MTALSLLPAGQDWRTG